MATVELKALSKTYAGGVQAVEAVDIAIRDGEFVVLVGPSGCGKSTILRMIAGLETVTGGEVRIGGAPVNRLEPGERDIAMVFQNYALYPHMSVRQNMSYGLRNQGMAKDEIARRIEEAARTLQLQDYLDRRPRQLSGGQRQRVAMGRAIVRDPKAFLFDEPLSNLDAKLRTQLRTEIKALHRRLGATFIYVTHDQVEAMSLADRIVLMNGGRIEQIGTPMELYDRPASRFVAEFIGTPPMNILPAESPAAQALATGWRAPAEARWLGVRPEALQVTSGPGMAGEVVLIEALGADMLAHVLPDGLDAPIVLRAHAMAGLAERDRVSLAPDAGSLRAFDADGRAVEPAAAVMALNE
ncbi:ABC transporter ATP-binding protein [Rhodosalinus sp. K401]|uniref:ABC transporter ATP-binding protein n=1 Tax=Rhodosalinus sp. K401 TaxID=3239195 RepID=UPI0035251C32